MLAHEIQQTVPFAGPEVEAYLNAEEAYATKQLAPLVPLAETLYQEIITHVAEEDASPPVKDACRQTKYTIWAIASVIMAK